MPPKRRVVQSLEKVSRLRADLLNTFVDKEAEIEAIIVGLLSGVPAILIGPYGAAKTSIVTRVARRIGGKVFVYLLTPHTDPNEIFGPLDLMKLRQGVLKRIIRNRLPDSHIAFLDEIFKGSSAILNALLEIIEHRVFDTGEEIIRVPLLEVYAASNEIPPRGDTVRQAIYDRFRIRCFSRYVDTIFVFDLAEASYRVRSDFDKLAPIITVDEIRVLQREVDEFGSRYISRDPSVRKLLWELMERAKPSLSDRAKALLPRVIAATMVYFLETEVSPITVAEAFLLVAPNDEDEYNRIVRAIEEMRIPNRESVRRELLDKLREAYSIIMECEAETPYCTKDRIEKAEQLIRIASVTAAKYRLPSIYSIMKKAEELQHRLEAIKLKRRPRKGTKRGIQEKEAEAPLATR